MSAFTSENINEIAAALSAFQGEVPTIEKKKSVEIKTKAGYLIKYNYADIADVMAAIRKPLSKNGLFVSHSIQITPQGRQIDTTVFHTSGQWLKSTMTLEHTSDEKSLGGKITYYRRYALGSLLGLVTDDDVDCDGQGGEMVEPKHKAKSNAKGAQNPAPKQEKSIIRTVEMQDFYRSNAKTPFFAEFIAYIADKTGNYPEEILRQGAERQKDFLNAVKAYALAEDKKALASTGKQEPKENKEKKKSTKKN